MIIDVADPSRVPFFAEPFFLNFNADCRFRIVLTPEDLGKAGLASSFATNSSSCMTSFSESAL